MHNTAPFRSVHKLSQCYPSSPMLTVWCLSRVLKHQKISSPLIAKWVINPFITTTNLIWFIWVHCINGSTYFWHIHLLGRYSDCRHPLCTHVGLPRSHVHVHFPRGHKKGEVTSSYIQKATHSNTHILSTCLESGHSSDGTALNSKQKETNI